VPHEFGGGVVAGHLLVDGLHFSANVPMAYQLISVASLFFYLKTKRFAIFRFIQLSLFWFAPFIMQWSIR